MRDRKAAVRYARAFFQDACQRQAVAEAGRALEVFGGFVRATPEFLDLLAHPLVPAAEKKRLCREQFGALVGPEQLNFLDVLIDRERARLLPAIAEHFAALVDEYQRIVRAEVWSAVPLTEEEQARLSGTLGRAFGGEPVLTVSVRPELLGGLRVRVKDAVVDGSLQTALENLVVDLKAAPMRT